MIVLIYGFTEEPWSFIRFCFGHIFSHILGHSLVMDIEQRTVYWSNLYHRIYYLSWHENLAVCSDVTI